MSRRQTTIEVPWIDLPILGLMRCDAAANQHTHPRGLPVPVHIVYGGSEPSIAPGECDCSAMVSNLLVGTGEIYTFADGRKYTTTFPTVGTEVAACTARGYMYVLHANGTVAYA